MTVPRWPEPGGYHEPVVMHNMHQESLPGSPYSGVKLCRKCAKTKTAPIKEVWQCTGGDRQVLLGQC